MMSSTLGVAGDVRRPPRSAGGEFLTFHLAGESYGIHILNIQEIRSYSRPAALPGAPDFIRGGVNLRGSIVPIIDLRIRFGMPSRAHDEFTAVIVLNIGAHVIGVVVDSVSDVVTLQDAAVQSAPAFASSAFNTEYMAGIGIADAEMIILLDVERLVTPSQLGLIAQAATTA